MKTFYLSIDDNFYFSVSENINEVLDLSLIEIKQFDFFH
jgi:hypothetical protein